MHNSKDEVYLQECVNLATASVATGGGPFAAIVVRAGQVVARACNQVAHQCDPTAHAEVEAIRLAARELATPHLTESTLYASCEPCPMCLAAILWAQIPRVRFAADHRQAQRAGFDDTRIAMNLYGQVRPASLETDWLDLQHVPIADAAAPFDAWLAKADRIPY
ncbi:MAG: nucleoside deaminase [Pseudomonas sp.]